MNRYLRQEVLKEIGVDGQNKIRDFSIAIVGVGALGTCSSELLVRAGIGKVLLIDKDIVSLVNLQRQLLFDENDLEKKKVLVAKDKLCKINSDVLIETCDDFLDETNVDLILNDFDLILDCTDNMKARHVINDYCSRFGKKWIYAAAVGVRGNVLVVDDPEKFSNIFKTGETFDSCEEIGVVNTITIIISSLQVTEAIKIILGKEYCKDLIRFNLFENSYEKIKL